MENYIGCHDVKNDTHNMKSHLTCSRISSVMVSVIAQGAVDREFLRHLFPGQIKASFLSTQCYI